MTLTTRIPVQTTERGGRLLLIIDAPGDRRVLDGWLASAYDVRQGEYGREFDGPFDLCILDDGAHARLWPRLSEAKRGSEPVFLPVVLLTSKHARAATLDVPAHDVDEVIEAPVSPATLRSRIDVLLERRSREGRLAAERDLAMTELRAAQEVAARELESTHLLLRAADAFNDYIDIDSVLDSLAALLGEATRGCPVSVALIDPGDSAFNVVAVSGSHGHERGARVALTDVSRLVARAVDRRGVMIDRRPASRRSSSRAATASWSPDVAVPLLAGDNVIGVAGIELSGRGPLGGREVELVEGIAAHASVAIENARLFHAERTTADRLQQALLAMPDTVTGIEFGHAYRSATQATRVGGDFYDIFELSGSLVGITIGDVAGKGLEAAALTSLVKNTVRAHAVERGKSPTDVVRLTNEVVYGATEPESFVTLFFGLFDRRDGRLVYVNAGHTSGMAISGHGVRSLGVTAPIVGAFLDVSFESAETYLGFEETLFLYTDGITESRRAGAFLGEEGLERMVADAPDETVVDLVRRVLDDVATYAGGALSDDVAVLALRRAPDCETGPVQQRWVV